MIVVEVRYIVRSKKYLRFSPHQVLSDMNKKGEKDKW